MDPVHFLSYSFTYLVAAAASEQIAFLKQRKAQFLLHRAYRLRLISSCLACYIGFWGCFGVSQEKTYAKHRTTYEAQLPFHAHFWDTDLCIMLLLSMEHYSQRQWEICGKYLQRHHLFNLLEEPLPIFWGKLHIHIKNDHLPPWGTFQLRNKRVLV